MISTISQFWALLKEVTNIILFCVNKVLRWRETINKKRKLISSAIDDLVFNINPGIGNDALPFQIERLKTLEEARFLKLELSTKFSQCIYNASLCNAYGGRRHLKVQPGHIKSLSRELIEDLNKELLNLPRRWQVWKMFSQSNI